VSIDVDPRCCRDEPGDHALGRSRGGLSTKIHAAVDGRGRPLAILLTPGQAGDAPMMLPLLAHLRVRRTIGRPRTRPDRANAPSTASNTGAGWPARYDKHAIIYRGGNRQTDGTVALADRSYRAP
jgi:hypothetical protein